MLGNKTERANPKAPRRDVKNKLTSYAAPALGKQHETTKDVNFLLQLILVESCTPKILCKLRLLLEVLEFAIRV